MKYLVLKGVLCTVAMLIVATVAFSQTGPPAAGTGPGGCFPPPCIPIDGGISLLIAAGIGIAGKKAYDHHKEK